MRPIKLRKPTLAAAVVCAVVLAGCLGCVSQTPAASTGSSDTPAPQEQAVPAEKKTLAEWVATYPNEGESYMASRMAHTYEAFAGACQMAFDAEDAPVACASCHAREDFAALYAEKGGAVLADNASDHQMEWSNCTNCHVGDPGEGVVKGGNSYGEATSASAAALFPERDFVCGQCHAMFPGAAYLEDGNRGIDQYKYGFDPDGMLKAMQEYYADNPVTETPIAAGMVGVPHYDEAIDATIYLDDACTAVEMFQNSNHQKLGLTCTDCHMPQTEAADGATYTSHEMTTSPLENPAALEKCLTCHKAQGIEDADAMVAFARGKMGDLAKRQEKTFADLNALHEALAAKVAAGETGEEVKAAQENYVRANVYFLFQLASTDEGVKTAGEMAPMNNAYCNELLDKADGLISESMEALA